MSQGPPERVRVTGPPRHRPAARRPVEFDAGSGLGDVYLDSLLAAQFRLAIRLVVLLVLGVGALPVVFFVAPGLVEVAPFGIPLPWLLLGFAMYPFLLGLGWWFVRGAERNERDFVDLTGRTAGDPR